jgi:hypothetical protein
MKLSKSAKTLVGLVAGLAVGIVIGITSARIFGDPAPDATESALKQRFGLWLVPFSILLALLATISAIAVHELGHLAGGLIARMRFLFYVVGPFRVERGDHDRLRVTLNRDVVFAGGAVAMIPTGTHDLKRRMLLLVAGGPLASLLLALLTFAFGHPLIHVVGIISLFIFIVTIIPMQSGGMMTDGKRMVRMMGKGPAAESEAALMALVSAWASGTEPREWPRDLVDRAVTAAAESIEQYNAHVFAYFHFLDAGDVDTARIHAMGALELADTLPPAFKPSMELEAAYFIAHYDGDVARARQLYEGVPKRGLGIYEYERGRTEAAILLAEGQNEEAHRIARAALDATPARNPFARARLEELIAGSQSN